MGCRAYKHRPLECECVLSIWEAWEGFLWGSMVDDCWPYLTGQCCLGEVWCQSCELDACVNVYVYCIWLGAMEKCQCLAWLCKCLLILVVHHKKSAFQSKKYVEILSKKGADKNSLSWHFSINWYCMCIYSVVFLFIAQKAYFKRTLSCMQTLAKRNVACWQRMF